MPVYILKCPKCKKEFDFYKLRSDSMCVCPKCGNDKGFEKLPTAPAIAFRGDGWTTTNYGESIDPTSVKGVKKIEKQDQTLDQKTLYKHRKEVTLKRRKVKIKGLPEVKRA